MIDFEQALKEEYGIEVETIKPQVAATFMGWTGRIRLNVTDYTLNSPKNRMELFKIMDDEDIAFWYEDGDFILSIYGYDVFEGAVLKMWGEEE